MEDKKRLGNERMQSIRMWKHETGLAMRKSNAVALKPLVFLGKASANAHSRIRRCAQALTVCAVIGIATDGAKAQESLPSCAECGELRFEARYAPRPIALLAKVRQPDLELPAELWYIHDSINEGLGVLSWNSQGQIVGTRFRYTTAVTSTVPRAFLWLPQAQYNLAAGVPQDLFELLHPNESMTPSFAWDISEEGLVVGGAGARAETAGETAHSWNLQLLPPSPTPPPSNFEIDFGSGDGDWSMALAVIPSSVLPLTPRIVGCGWGICDEWREPFEFSFGIPQSAAVLPHCEPPLSGLGLPENIARRAWACDIASHESNPVGSYDQSQEVRPNNPCQSFCVICPDRCNGPMVVGAHFPCSFYRVAGSLPSAVPPSDQRTGIRSSSGAMYGGSDLFPILSGYHMTQILSSGPCPQVAALWTYNTTSTLRNELPSVFARAGTGALDEPIAQRWRKFECPCSAEVVVGWGAEKVGALWTTSLDPSYPAGFEAHSVRELLVDFAAPPSPTVHVEQLYDILPTGEILALVRRELGAGESDLFACILGVRGDLTGDHAVTAADLSVFLSHWGGPYEADAPQVVADLNWDTSVDSTDLSLFLSWWTGAPMRLLLPADNVVPDPAHPELAGASICMLLPSEECDVIGANLRLDTTYTEECLRCAVVAFGFEHPDAFAAWLAITPPEATETVCTCVSAFMKTMLEENNDE